MAWNTCDNCSGHEYTDDNPFVEMRQARPSDPSDICTVLAGHLKCVGGLPLDQLPQISLGGGVATPKQWEDWETNGTRAKLEEEAMQERLKTHIEFTQYLRPHGMQRKDYIERPKDILDMAKAIQETGLIFTMEELADGTAVFYITNNEEEEDVATAMCKNGPLVPETIDKMIRDYYDANIKTRS